jgi:hypothetical protein
LKVEAFFNFIPDLVLKRRKNLFPLKNFISQLMWNADFIGLEGCEMKFFNGPIKNKTFGQQNL